MVSFTSRSLTVCSPAVSPGHCVLLLRFSTWNLFPPTGWNQERQPLRRTSSRVSLERRLDWISLFRYSVSSFSEAHRMFLALQSLERNPNVSKHESFSASLYDLENTPRQLQVEYTFGKKRIQHMRTDL